MTANTATPAQDEAALIPRVKTEWHEWLELDLLELDECEIECNGMTWAISYLLTQAGIEHECFAGYVLSEYTGEAVTPHYWIKLRDGWYIDFRLRMWLGDNDEVPHGVFHEADAWWLGMRYEGNALQKEGVEFNRDFVMNLTDEKVSQMRLMPQPSKGG